MDGWMLDGWMLDGWMLDGWMMEGRMRKSYKNLDEGDCSYTTVSFRCACVRV